MTTFTPVLRQSTHVITVIHEKVSRKKLESSTSVASSSSKAETQPKRKETKVFHRFGGAAPNLVIKPRKQKWTLDAKKGRANLSERKMKT